MQRNARCARRAAGLMVLVTAFAGASLGYSTILVENFPYHAPPLLLNVIYAVGVGSLVSLLTFAVLGMVYRMKLRSREKAGHPRATFEGPLTQHDKEDFGERPKTAVGTTALPEQLNR